MIKLTYFSGSPFARMCRVLVIEWALPVTPVEYSFPPGPEMFAINPLGQVPALVADDGRPALFPTFLILEELWSMAGKPAAAYDPGRDRQLLMVILQACDAYAAACYYRWHGLGQVGRNAFDFTPRERNLDRVQNVLDWVENGVLGKLEPGVTVPGVALACLCKWADAREGLDWRSRPGLAAVVEELALRRSFDATIPRVFSYE
jgi:glutathione S-transferase